MSNPTSKAELLTQLEAIDEKAAKKILVKFLEYYMTPAFGSLPKREVDIAVFQCLQELDVFDSTPEIYSLLSSLRITRSKARNLLYESNLRKSNNEALNNELVDILKDPLLKDNDKVCLEVGNPLLIDHIRYVLKELNHITDSSFSPELIRLSPDAYAALINTQLARVSKKDIDAALIKCGAKTKVNAETLLKAVLKKIGKKVADDAGNEAAEYLGDYLGDLFSGATEQVTSFLANYNKESVKAAKK
jgi:hypothetical protein